MPRNHRQTPQSKFNHYSSYRNSKYVNDKKYGQYEHNRSFPPTQTWFAEYKSPVQRETLSYDNVYDSPDCPSISPCHSPVYIPTSQRRAPISPSYPLTYTSPIYTPISPSHIDDSSLSPPYAPSSPIFVASSLNHALNESLDYISPSWFIHQKSLPSPIVIAPTEEQTKAIIIEDQITDMIFDERGSMMFNAQFQQAIASIRNN
jgi:hypothetical protein